MESLIEQENFLNQIQEIFKSRFKNSSNGDEPSQNDKSSNNHEEKKEEEFKQKFQFLVNKLIKEETSHTFSKKDISKDDESNLNHPKSKSKEKRTRNKYDSASMLSSSVFELDEDKDESGKYYLSDEDSSSNEDNDSDTLNNMSTGSSQLKHVLTKRSSNIGGETFTRQSSFNKTNKISTDFSKYSCSLPRDIPIMNNRHMAINKKIDAKQQQREELNNDNNFKENKSHSVMMNSYRNESSLLKRIPSNDLIDSEENDPFDTKFDDDSEEAPENMGRAISTLASSIVLKDGRELFGGVPSRRVPINSISKSCFD